MGGSDCRPAEPECGGRAASGAQPGTSRAPDRDMTVRQGTGKKAGKECPTFSSNGKASQIAARLTNALGQPKNVAVVPGWLTSSNSLQNSRLQGVAGLLARWLPKTHNPGNYRRKSPSPVPSERALLAVMPGFSLLLSLGLPSRHHRRSCSRLVPNWIVNGIPADSIADRVIFLRGFP